MALNTSPSFGPNAGMAQRVAGQRAARRRAIPQMGGKAAMGAQPPSTGMAGQAATMRRSSPGAGAGIGPSPFMNFGYKGAQAMGNLGNPKSMSFGYNPGGGMPPSGGPPMGGSPAPQRVQAPPLMDAGMPQPVVGEGLVANTAPQFDMAGAGERLRQKMGGNTGITGGRFGRNDIAQMY